MPPIVIYLSVNEINISLIEGSVNRKDTNKSLSLVLFLIWLVPGTYLNDGKNLFFGSTIFLHRNIQITILVRAVVRFEKTIIFNDRQCVIAISIAELRSNLLPDPLVWRNVTCPRFVSERSCSFVTHSYPQKICSRNPVNII